jgi:two-component system chemotaxis response regulator CheB
MPFHDTITIGGSTGSLDPLRRLCADLPADLPASVFVVVHVGAQGRNHLAGILDGSGPLRATTAVDGEPIERGRIYVAPADHHLLLVEGAVRLGRGPRENMTRPAIDPLFRSAAAAYGPRVIGVILSGKLNDGSSGLAAVKQCGGLAVVQNPSDADAAEMPVSALRCCEVDHMAPASGLGRLLNELASEPAPPPRPVPPGIVLETGFALGRPSDSLQLRQIASPCTLPCPSCGGVLSEVNEPEPLRFRCQIGHAYTAECLDHELDEPTRQAMTVALRALEARATLMERMAADDRAKGRERSATDFDDRARDYRRDMETIRQAVLRSG